MLSFRDMILKWPSSAAFASDIGLSVQSASNMKARDSVSSKYWSLMVLAAQERGIEGITLTALTAAANSRRQKAAA